MSEHGDSEWVAEGIVRNKSKRYMHILTGMIVCMGDKNGSKAVLY
jgi:hypothetical protein